MFGQEGRYAHALYSAAAKSSALEAVEADLATVGSLIQSNAALNSFLVNPRFVIRWMCFLNNVQISSVLKMRSQKIEPRNQLENSTWPKWMKFGMEALLLPLSGATVAIL